MPDIAKITRRDTEGFVDDLPWSVPMERWPSGHLERFLADESDDAAVFERTQARARRILRARA